MVQYNKQPVFPIDGEITIGWRAITDIVKMRVVNSTSGKYILVVECYHGVDHNELLKGFALLEPNLLIQSKDAFWGEEKIKEITYPDVTDDAIFGYITRLSYEHFIDNEKVAAFQKKMDETKGLIIVYGHAATLMVKAYDCLVYADMARWEIQLRQRRHEVNNLGLRNADESPSLQYKRSYFVDWRVCDRLKKQLFNQADFWLDTNKKNEPKIVEAHTMLNGLSAIVQSPFRVVPYFDPGPWGGQWMRRVFNLDQSKKNFAWSFDGVPEENSLLLKIGEEIFEIPSINLVFYKSKELLGEPVEARFGKEFPIRFDFLDTIDGGNLSLQVHPSTQYIRDNFGMYYTQDESYYILDAKPDAKVYIGVKPQVKPQEMIADLYKAQTEGTEFDAEKYVNVFPAKKHDHFLLPSGTIHCSGANSMVLEISATPYIFTFKLYDWLRLGLDGKPRAINIAHGSNVIQWERDTAYCEKNLINQFQPIAVGDGWREERTGLHKNEFIETRRHWFTKKVLHNTGESVNVLNLIEGSAVIVESPTDAFAPFEVHYAETFIVPATVGAYTIRPFGESEGQECATIKAFVRI